MNFQTMNKQRKFVLIAAAVGVISMFLPWFLSLFRFWAMTNRSENGLHGNGIFVFLCFIACGVIAYLGDQTKNLDKTMWAIALSCGSYSIVMYYWILFQQ